MIDKDNVICIYLSHINAIKIFDNLSMYKIYSITALDTNLIYFYKIRYFLLLFSIYYHLKIYKRTKKYISSKKPKRFVIMLNNAL